MLVVASICVAAGTWQIQRLIEKHDANKLLRANALGLAAPVHDILSTATSAAATARTTQARFRTITATGVYLPAQQALVREQTVGDTVGYLVLVQLRIAARADAPGADLLVVRGFIPAQGEQAPTVPAAPEGIVSVRARVQPADTADDEFGHVPGQIRTINTGQIAGRLHTDVYAGYAELLAGQPGTAGLTVIPDPDLSNAAGGAIEPQHVAYIIQWYLFALIALCAPVVMARSEAQREPDEAPVRARAKADPWAALDGYPNTGADAALSRSGQSSLPPDRMRQRYGTNRRF